MISLLLLENKGIVEIDGTNLTNKLQLTCNFTSSKTFERVRLFFFSQTARKYCVEPENLLGGHSKLMQILQVKVSN